jgi:hypothetical protein
MTRLIWMATTAVLFACTWWLGRITLTTYGAGILVVAVVAAVMLATVVVTSRAAGLAKVHETLIVRFDKIGGRVEQSRFMQISPTLLVVFMIANVMTPVARYTLPVMVVGAIVGMGWLTAQMIRPTG